MGVGFKWTNLVGKNASDLSVVWEVLMCFHVLRIQNHLRLRSRNSNPERTLFLLPPQSKLKPSRLRVPICMDFCMER